MKLWVSLGGHVSPSMPTGEMESRHPVGQRSRSTRREPPRIETSMGAAAVSFCEEEEEEDDDDDVEEE